MTDILKFKQALQHSERYQKRHLLLGNGFSIACRPGIFAYDSLFKKADFPPDSNLPKVFEIVGTTDFERAIKALEDASRVAPVYSREANDTAEQMANDAEELKDILIRTVAGNHPGRPYEIENEQFQACRRFLSHFLDAAKEKGNVYTLNYDLLLYWTLMHKDEDPINLIANDGFGRDEDTEPEYVNWMGESSAEGQRVHYLHGALHLFDAGDELQKYTWKNTGIPLLEQAREEMGEGKFPLFVAEGNSKQKLTKIKHSAYLHHTYKSFSKQMEQPKDALFIFGHSLAGSDWHILKKIARGSIPQIYVGLYGDPESKDNEQIRKAANELSHPRKPKSALKVAFFDAESAKVWGA